MRLLLITLLFVAGSFSISFSQPTIDFEETIYDFGEINEGAMAIHEFVFTNNGNQPLVLTAVKASCGCTTPSWTKEPVLPGQSGHIKASYNSKNRPGGFHKSITITSNAITASQVVFIKGTAIKKTALEPLFDKEELARSPRILLQQQHLQLGKVQMGSSHPINLLVHNEGKSPLEIKGIYSTCRCLSIMPNSLQEVMPGSKANLELVFTPRAQGEFTYGAQILSNDLVQPKYQFYITSDVTPQPNASSVVKEAPTKISFKGTLLVSFTY